MELVEGETLADRLQRGRFPPQEALTVAREIALALEAAHQKGVLHRDLKPSNIRLLPDGRVKLLDFGLARALREATLDSRLDTETSPHSEPGAVLGTAPYMSPEQARGQELDRRSDVWAFGCVLFEMLAGKRAFDGATFSDTVAAVLEHEPDWQALPPKTPATALRLLPRCLQKEKDKRLRDIGDARLELEETLAGAASGEEARREPRRDKRWTRMAVLATVLAAILAGGGLWLIRQPPAAPKEVVHLSMEAWGDLSDLHAAPLLAPSGDRIVYMARPSLVIRELKESEWRVIPGTADGNRPFFSPDGRWLGFSAGRSIKKVSLAGGTPVTGVASVTVRENVGTTRFGASWGPDDNIVYTLDGSSGLWQVAASGGEPRELTKPDRARGEKTHRWPHHLPGGKVLLFTVGTNRSSTYDDARIEALVLGTGARRTVIEGGSAPAYIDGHVLFRRGASILAVPFDLDRLAVTGGPAAVIEGLRSSPTGEPFFTIASTGTLAYVPRIKPSFRLVLVDRAGQARPLTPIDAALLWEPRVSPDGRAVAAIKVAPNNQVWRFDIERENFTRLTFEWDTSAPTWTPDGKFLIFSSGPELRLHRVHADGRGAPEPLSSATGARQYPRSVTADGKLLAYEEGEDIWIMPLAPRGEPRLFLQTPASEGSPAISPNGRLIAYQSDESGEMEVYLRSFPDGGDKVQVSSGGGWAPVWPRSGKELFYSVPLEGSKGRIMAVSVSPEPPVRASPARLLFEHRYEALDYDVFPDGQHFVMSETDNEAMRVTHFNVVLNWFEELKRLVPPK
jgi:serine/threonine-protein kinase